MEEYFSDDISDRQAQVIVHTMKYIGGSTEGMAYIKSQEYFDDLFPIDVAIFEPTENVNYFIMQTSGLSSYYMDKNVKRSELIMVLPSTWKPLFDKPEYDWPRELLLDIAYGMAEAKTGPMVGNVFVPNEIAEYAGSPNIVGGIIVLPEQFPLEFCEEEIEESYTKFLQVVPITKDDLAKIEEIGPGRFIEYELHDSEGPLFIVNLQEKKLEGIEKIIKENEDALKGVEVKETIEKEKVEKTDVTNDDKDIIDKGDEDNKSKK